jgi:transcriptional regulator with XRE-family HTH domain
MFNDETDMELKKEFGTRMRRARLRQNITQAVLARKAGVSLTSVKEAEDGRIRTVRVLLAVLRVLGRLKDFELLMDMPDISPREAAKLKGRRRKRAS